MLEESNCRLLQIVLQIVLINSPFLEKRHTVPHVYSLCFSKEKDGGVSRGKEKWGTGREEEDGEEEGELRKAEGKSAGKRTAGE